MGKAPEVIKKDCRKSMLLSTFHMLKIVPGLSPVKREPSIDRVPMSLAMHRILCCDAIFLGVGGVGVGETGLLRDQTFETHLYGNRKDVVGDRVITLHRLFSLRTHGRNFSLVSELGIAMLFSEHFDLFLPVDIVILMMKFCSLCCPLERSELAPLSVYRTW